MPSILIRIFRQKLCIFDWNRGVVSITFENCDLLCMRYYILHFWLEWRRCIYALGTREIQLLHFSQKLLHRLNYWTFSKFFTIYQIIEHFSQKWLHLLNYWTGFYYISSPQKILVSSLWNKYFHTVLFFIGSPYPNMCSVKTLQIRKCSNYLQTHLFIKNCKIWSTFPKLF